MNFLRTPEACFDNLPEFPFEPHYIEGLPGFEALRMHYLDEGPRGGSVALCLHGQPTWSYLYRKMIPAFVGAGMRVLAPDMFGFGKSDKPTDDATYGFTFHRSSLFRFVEHMDLRNATLVCQDWGGLLGLTLPMHLPGRFSKLIVMNTTLGTGDVPLGAGFLSWRAFNNRNPDMDIAGLMTRAVPTLSTVEAAAYAAPFPSASYKAGVRRFPNLVPDHPEADGALLSRTARDWWKAKWSGRSFMAIGMQDPVLGAPAMRILHNSIRGCPPPLELAHAGHFVQELGREIVDRALESFVL
jgi:haloalkane dehalogenase